MMRHFLCFFLMALFMTLSFSNCSDDDAASVSANGARTYQYECIVPNANETITIVLDSVSSPIATINSSAPWVIATQAGNKDTHPVLQIQASGSQPNTQNTAKVTVVLEDGNTVIISILQGFNFVPDSNSNDKFLTDWESQDTVVIFSQHGYESVYTPWSTTFSSTTLPTDICRNVKKKDGWEMAFNTLGNSSARDMNYFGLYNPYLGILRVFCYITDANTNGSEYSFEVILGSESTTNKYPFYNSLAYSIPSSYDKINNKTDLSNTNASSPRTFRFWATPYSSTTSTALTRGWTAFDIDMSGYIPAGKDFFSSQENITIVCGTQNQQSITLAGSLTADISGKYSSATPAASSTSGISSTLSSLGSMLGDVQNSALAQIEQTLTGKSLDVGFYYAGSACNIASFVYDWIMDDGGLNETNIDSLPGKIELNLTGEISLSGYIKNWASNPIVPVTLNSSVFKTTNPESHVGKGLWGLAESPVVYVVDDHFLGAQRRINLTVGENNTYATTDGNSNEMRLVTFMDPQNIKLNINTDLFPDISDVQVVCYYGVYPNAEKGHTNNYRNLLDLKMPTSVDLVNRNTTKPGSIFRTTNSGNKMTYHQVDKEKLISPSIDGDASNCSMVKQAGSNYSYYGRLMSEGSNDPHGFMIDPQVFFPVSEDGKTIYDGEIPDFVVCVYVTFKSGNRTYQFSRRYLPEVKLISGNSLRSKQSELQQYVDKCKKGQPINYLNGGNNVGVIHPNGAKQIEKTMNLLKTILGN